MDSQSSKHDEQQSGEGLPPIDRRVLLGTLAVVAGGFASAWLGARGFLPGAQLFPYVVSAMGVAVTLAAVARVWRGHEPSNRPGQRAESNEQAKVAYGKAIRTVCAISSYFIAIYLLGFMPATALFVVVFARAYSQSFAYAAGAAVAALVAVYALSYALDLFLPAGLIVELVTGG